ncbi:MAK10-like protein, partial [Tanacetum coccineum]
MERFEKAIFKQREEINDRMAEIFELLKELTTSRAAAKVLIREEAKSSIIKNVNSISLARGEEKRNDTDDIAANDGINMTDTEMLVKEAEKENEAEMEPKTNQLKEPKENKQRRHPALRPSPRIAEDVLVEVAEHVYPMDFVILDIKEDERRPFILGTPFLTTANVVIKFDKGTITLRSGKSKISFHRRPESLCNVEKGIKNDIEPIAPTMT